MAITPPRFNPNQPIPNSPFYSAPTNFVQGATGPLIVGSGLTVDYTAGTLNSAGGAGLVTSVTAGAGITVTPPAGTGAVTVAMTTPAVTAVTASVPLVSSGGLTPDISMSVSGVVAGTYTNADIVVDQFGRVTSATSGTPGGVTSIAVTAPITDTGTATAPNIGLADTAVTPGSYTAADITVDAQGRLTSASNGSVLAPAILTAKGDLISASAAFTPAVLPIGTAGQVLTVDAAETTGMKWVTPAPAGVVSVTGTAPIVSSGGANPDISLANSGVAAGAYTYASVTVDAKGIVSYAVSGTAPNTTVTSPITNTGTAVEPVIGVDTATTGQLGVVQVGTNIDVSSGTISVKSSSTTEAGIVQLNDTVASTSDTEALTANQGKLLQDQISALSVAGSLTLAGTFDASTSQMLTVTTAGATASFAIGSNLPAPLPGNADYFVIVTTGGTYTPPGAGGPILTFTNLVGGTGYTPGTYLGEPLDGGTGSGATADITVGPGGDITSVVLVSGGATYNVGNTLTAFTPTGTPWSIEVATVGPSVAYVTGQGDWLLSNGLIWEFLNVGPELPAASTGTAGIVQLATSAETQTGTNTTKAITPAGAAATYVPLSGYTAKGAVLAASGANTPVALAVGTDGQVLSACAACTTGLAWTTSTPAIPCATITAKGQLIAGTAAGTFATVQAAGTGLILASNAAVATGMQFITPPYVTCATYSAKGTILAASGPNAPVGLAVGTDGQALVADSTCASGIKWGSVIPADATPTAAGIILGCTTAANTALGCNVLLALTSGTNNVALGASALKGATTGQCNVAVGYESGCAITTGSQNVAIGPSVSVPIATASCQLAIGFAAGQNWLTGDSSKNIIPGAGITDCAASVGTAGQVLTSTGTALEWRTAPLSADYCAKGVVLAGCAVGSAIAVGPAASDCYWLMSCDACPGGVTFACIPPFLGDTPVGSVQFFASNVAPTGWLPADGRTISRASYASLFAAIGTTYGAGDGSTTFQIPDMRGMFPRGWDAAGGTARNCDPGRAFGSTQLSALGTHCHLVSVCPGAAAVLEWANADPTSTQRGYGAPSNTSPNSRQAGFTDNTGGTETRPVNVALLPCIKYEITTAPLTPAGGIPCACITGKGAILTGSAASTPTALPVGTTGQILVSNSACATGLSWCDSLLTAVNAAVSYQVTAGCLIGGVAQILVPGVNGVAMTADYNSCGWFNPATGCFRPTIAGYYQVNYQLGTTTSTGSIAPALYCNGAILSAGRAANNVCNGGIGTIAMSQTVYMNGSTDYLQIGGASSSIPATLTGTRFSAALTGAITTLPASYQVSQFPTWTSAGTVQAVGISTLANPQPTVGTTSQNQVRYRQIGPKEWEVQSVLYATANSTSAGNGDYLFTLPAGLQFDVSSPFQQPYTNVPSEALGWTAYALANGWATVSRNGAGAYQQSLILPYDATRYRIILIGPNVLFWSSGYYQLGAGTPSYYKWGFTFTAP